MSDDNRTHRTTITLHKDVRDTLAADKPDDMDWNEYVLALHESAPIEVKRVVEVGELDDLLSESLTVDIPLGDMQEAARVGAEDALGKLQ